MEYRVPLFIRGDDRGPLPSIAAIAVAALLAFVLAVSCEYKLEQMGASLFGMHSGSSAAPAVSLYR